MSKIVDRNSLKLVVGNEELPVVTIDNFDFPRLAKEVRARYVEIKDPAQISAFFRRLSRHIKNTTTTAFRLLVFDVYNNLIVGTPYRTGLAKSHWQIARNRWPTAIAVTKETIRKLEKNPIPSAIADGISLARASLVVRTVNYKDTVYMANHVRYVKYLDAGSSLQAPKGFIRTAVFHAIRDFRFRGAITARTLGLDKKPKSALVRKPKTFTRRANIATKRRKKELDEILRRKGVKIKKDLPKTKDVPVKKPVVKKEDKRTPEKIAKDAERAAKKQAARLAAQAKRASAAIRKKVRRNITNIRSAKRAAIRRKTARLAAEAARNKAAAVRKVRRNLKEINDRKNRSGVTFLP